MTESEQRVRRQLWIDLPGLFLQHIRAAATDASPNATVRFTHRFLIIAGLAALPISMSYAAEVSLPTLTNAQQVIDLGIEGARFNPHPVRLRAVITYPSPFVPRRLYVQDTSAGIQIAARRFSFQAKPGQILEIEGTAAAGAFYTFVNDATVRLVGEAPLPAARPVTADRLAAGAEFAQWVSLTALVLDVAVAQGQLWLSCSADGDLFPTVVTLNADMPLPIDWLDAVVELRGVTWTFFDDRNQPSGFRFHVPDTNHVAVLRPGSSNAFARPLVTSAALRARAPDAHTRVKVSGVVTHAAPSGLIYLQDETGPMRAESFGPIQRDDHRGKYVNRPPLPRLRPGDRVELVGVPLTGQSLAPSLAHAEYCVVGRSALPEPQPVSTREARSGDYDGRLVRVRARLMDRETIRSGALVQQSLWLQGEGGVFEALYQGETPEPLAVEKDSYLEVNGICAVRGGELQQARTFRLHLRSSADVVPLVEPPMWLSGPVLKIAGAATLTLAAALTWVALLRRQVRRRTEELWEANKRLATAGEEAQRSLARERELNEMKSGFVSLVSHEFRTPLGVIMSATDVLQRYFERLPEEKRARHLDMILRSTRNLATLIEEVLLLGKVEGGQMRFVPAPVNVAGLCRTLVDEVNSATQGACPIQFVIKTELAVAISDESLVRHILTNLLSNAVKYSEPGIPVNFTVERRGDDVVFTIRDRGIGISSEDRKDLFKSFARGRNVGERPGTGLGLVIVKRCVELHGGKLTIESELGRGTTVTVTLPAFSQTPRSSARP